MLDALVGELASVVKGRPKLVFQLLLVYLVLYLFSCFEKINFSLIIAEKLPYVFPQERLYLMVSVIFAILFLLVYIILLKYFYNRLRCSFLDAIIGFNIKNIGDILNRLSKSCLIKDVKITKELAAFSITILASYYFAIAFLIYVFDAIFWMIAKVSSFSYVEARTPALLFLLTLFLLLLLFAFFASEESFSERKDSSKEGEALLSWLHSRLERYLSLTCNNKETGKGRVTTSFIRMITPIPVIPFSIDIVVTPPQLIPWSIVEERFTSIIQTEEDAKRDAKNRSEEGERPPYRLIILSTIKSKEEIAKPIDINKMKKGLTHFLHTARLEKCGEPLGIVFFSVISHVSVFKHPLRSLSRHRVIVSQREEEEMLFIMGLGKPDIQLFMYWLMLAFPSETCS